MNGREATKPPFGELLRERRIAAGLSQAQLAERARISVQAVSALERGARSAPRTDTLALLIESLELDERQREDFERIARASVKQKVRTVVTRAGEPTSIVDLPRFETRFIGRERERAELERVIVPGRCVTLWGFGGVGKTRLAVDTVAHVRNAYANDVVFVSLETTLASDTVEGAVAASLGIREAHDVAVGAQIVTALTKRHMLLVLDNCEHVLSGVAALVSTIVQRAPTVAILCTSREPLRVAFEHVVEIRPFAIPDAMRLFEDRSHTNDIEPRAVEAICRRLEGIALAIELAAAMTRALEIGAIDRALDDRMLVLKRGNRTLRDTIAWSYDLLTPIERIVFERLAIVNGSFTLDMAIAIAADVDRSDPVVIDAVASLVDKTLVGIGNAHDGPVRTYRLLEATRAFAASLSQAERSDIDPASGRRALGVHLIDIAKRSTEALRDGNSERVAAINVDNVRGYLHWAVDEGHDAEQAALLAGSLAAFWDFSGKQLEGVRWIESALARLPARPSDRSIEIIALVGIAGLKCVLARYWEAKNPAARAYELACEMGDSRLRAVAAKNLGIACAALGEHDDARARIEEAIDIYQILGDDTRLRLALMSAAVIAGRAGRHDVARERSTQVADLYARSGNRHYAARVMIDVGEAEFALANTDAAIEIGRGTITELREVGTSLVLAKQLNNLGAYLLEAQFLDEAATCAREALDLCGDGAYRNVATQTMRVCALIGALRGQHVERCAEVFGYVDAEMTAGRLETGYTESRTHDRLRGSLSAALAEPLYATAIARGCKLDDGSADLIARSLL